MISAKKLIMLARNVKQHRNNSMKSNYNTREKQVARLNERFLNAGMSVYVAGALAIASHDERDNRWEKKMDFLRGIHGEITPPVIDRLDEIVMPDPGKEASKRATDGNRRYLPQTYKLITNLPGDDEFAKSYDLVPV